MVLRVEGASTFRPSPELPLGLLAAPLVGVLAVGPSPLVELPRAMDSLLRVLEPVQVPRGLETARHLEAVLLEAPRQNLVLQGVLQGHPQVRHLSVRNQRVALGAAALRQLVDLEVALARQVDLVVPSQPAGLVVAALHQLVDLEVALARQVQLRSRLTDADRDTMWRARTKAQLVAALHV